MRELSHNEAKVCYKLYRNGCFGGHWLQIDTAASGFPSHELDTAKEAIDELIRDGILIEKPAKHGNGVFINPKLRQEVYERVRAHEDFAWLPK